ncbi:MAG: ABC transporter substrate-binding protein [Armatimonadetes bacterium]|nr:ABC transporter substrate-binding protein [Armatimonadota bacterium]
MALSRRQLLRLATAAGAAGALRTVVGSGHRTRAEAAAARPKQGGVLKIAWTSSPRSLDPALGISGDEYMISQNMYDNLVRIDEKLQPQPQLATRWQPNERGDVWTFTLRQGVKFHHGRGLTAKDVVFTFERLLDPKTGSPGRTAMGPIQKVEAVDDYTVRFRLAVPYADLPLVLGIPFGRILPADRADLITAAPSGSGPFRLAEFRPGEYIRMVKFQNYWDGERPYLNELWQVTIPNVAGHVAALSGGEIQAMFEVPVAYIPALSRAPGVSLVDVKSPGFQPIVMMPTARPFDNPKVRQAMKYLVDREVIIRTIWQGRATVADDHPVPTINPYYVVTSPKHTYDVARARALLAEAGYPGGLSIELWTTGERAGMQELAVAAQQMAAPAGLRIEVRSVPYNVHVSTVFKKRPFYVSNWFGRATIDETLHPYFHTGGAWNEGYSNRELDRMLDDGRSQVDLRKRKAIYTQAQQLIHDDGHWVVVYHTSFVVGMRSSVKGHIVHPLRYWDFRWTSLES